jgi:hypothetical protein
VPLSNIKAADMRGRNEKYIKSLVSNSEETMPLGRPKHRQQYNIKKSPKETRCECVGLIKLV